MIKNRFFLSAFLTVFLPSCGPDKKQSTESNDVKMQAGMSGIVDNVSQKNIVQVALGSKDHSTLVTALKAAGLVDVLANPGPFTVFAPTNEAFEKLPKGTVEDLLKPEKKADLQKILYYHVNVSIFKAENFKDGQVMNMFSGGPANFTVKNNKVYINGAAIIASVPCSNGIIHVIDGVLLPPAKN